MRPAGVVDVAHTVFVDDGLAPFADQWGFLAGIQRIEPATVDAIADQGTRRGEIIGLQISQSEDLDAEQLWALPSLRQPKAVALPEPVPAEVRVVLAQRLFVEKARLPSALLNRIKRLAAFQNPEFYRRQKGRLSTALTPRVIACAEDLPQHLALPRGCAEDLAELLGSHGATLRVDDRRVEGRAIDARFHGELTPVQQEAVKNLLAHDTGVLVAPPGMGKTVVGTHLTAARGRSTLVLVHRKPPNGWITQRLSACCAPCRTPILLQNRPAISSARWWKGSMPSALTWTK